MGFLGGMDRRTWVGAVILTALFTALDYAFHYFFPDYGIPSGLAYAYFLPKIFLIPAFWGLLSYGHKVPFVPVSRDVQVAALLALALSLRYYLLGGFDLSVQGVFAVAHFIALYVSLKLYGVVV